MTDGCSLWVTLLSDYEVCRCTTDVAWDRLAEGGVIGGFDVYLITDGAEGTTLDSWVDTVVEGVRVALEWCVSFHDIAT